MVNPNPIPVGRRGPRGPKASAAEAKKPGCDLRPVSARRPRAADQVDGARRERIV